MSSRPLSHEALLEAADALVPLFREKAREAELARRSPDDVIEAVKASGLYSMMVPRRFGGHEADVDTFFEVVLRLGRADASLAWLTAFYIEHNHWALGFEEHVLEKLFADEPFVLAPVSLNAAGGGAERVDGGFRLNGQWSWGTCIVHGDWVMPVGIVAGEAPQLFLLPKSEVELIDTWFVSGMCGTGSLDYRIDDVFVPEDHAVPMTLFFGEPGKSPLRYDAPIFQTPLGPILAFAAGLPLLGAAQGGQLLRDTCWTGPAPHARYCGCPGLVWEGSDVHPAYLSSLLQLIQEQVQADVGSSPASGCQEAQAAHEILTIQTTAQKHPLHFEILSV